MREKKVKKIIITIWVIFILLVAGLCTFVVMNWDNISADLFGNKNKYTAVKSGDVHNLVNTYLKAMATADEKALKSLVTDPSQFDDMTMIISKSKVVTDYNNLVCYVVDGPVDNTYIVYPVYNSTINGVESTPLDIMSPLYIITDSNAKLLIDNRTKDKSVEDYINTVTESDSIQEVYRMVKEDEEKCMEEDPSFKEFYEKLN